MCSMNHCALYTGKNKWFSQFLFRGQSRMAELLPCIDFWLSVVSLRVVKHPRLSFSLAYTFFWTGFFLVFLKQVLKLTI